MNVTKRKIILGIGGLVLFIGVIDTANLVKTGTVPPESSDFSVYVNSQNQLSNLSKMVQDRAKDNACKNDSTPFFNVYQEKGYPGLKNAYMSDKPLCPNNSDHPGHLFSDNQFNDDIGYDMEGIYSREYFEVKEPIMISKNGDSWFENSFEGAFSVNYENYSSYCINSSKVGGYGIFFDEGFPESRNLRLESNQNMSYCNLDQNLEYSSSEQIKLCPGDEGYIQVNKGIPSNDGEAEPGAKIYSYVQIEDFSTENCTYSEENSNRSHLNKIFEILGKYL